jgi:hypothetical protein
VRPGRRSLRARDRSRDGGCTGAHASGTHHPSAFSDSRTFRTAWGICLATSSRDGTACLVADAHDLQNTVASPVVEPVRWEWPRADHEAAFETLLGSIEFAMRQPLSERHDVID